MDERKPQECGSSSEMSCNSTETENFVADSFPSSSNSNYNSDSMEVEDCTWRGTPLSELHLNIGMQQFPPVKPTKNHTVLFQLPVVIGQPLKPFPAKAVDVWDKDHVRMPHSKHSLYPVTELELRRRWGLVQEALTKSVLSSQQLEEAILHYNSKYSSRWNFDSLHMFFSETLEEEETEHFFSKVLPDIIQLALSLPSLITGGIPMLKRKRTHSITLSQQQISSLLANAFLCTFPRRNTSRKQSEYNTYPDINFNRLFLGSNVSPRVHEKLKCLINYFRRVCTKVPEGAVTYSRHHIPTDQLPNWRKETVYLPKLHVSRTGTIEDQGGGMMQVDFANKFVGGGVLGKGCVQEEIRFIICPELILSRLFTECLEDNEALIVTGVERFSNYEGYANNFQWAGDCQDQTPRDAFGRRYCTVVAVDAVCYLSTKLQYSQKFVNRELNKAFVGFSWGTNKNSQSTSGDGGFNTAIATGNWGCGAFGGEIYLKALLQLMAAARAGRDVAYFTFGDKELRDKLADIHEFLTQNKVTVGHLWNLICQYNDTTKENDLYSYLYKAVNNNAGVSFKIEEKHPANQSSQQTHSSRKESPWFLNSQEIEAALENIDEAEDTSKEQSVSKCKLLERKSYSVSSDMCVQRQCESWDSLNQSKIDFGKCKSVNKIESDVSPEKQRTVPLKRKISDYFSPTSKS